jgi:hypothetical protein
VAPNKVDRTLNCLCTKRKAKALGVWSEVLLAELGCGDIYEQEVWPCPVSLAVVV